MKYILDSNVFYYYLMVKHNLDLPTITINQNIGKEQFLEFINANKKNLSISAVSILELSTRFKNDPSTIKRAV